MRIASVLSFGVGILLWIATLTAAAQEPQTAEHLPFRDPRLDVADRVEDLLNRLTLKEKIALLHGDFQSGGIPRLDVGPLLLADGPLGVRWDAQPGETRATALPSTLALAATW